MDYAGRRLLRTCQRLGVLSVALYHQGPDPVVTAEEQVQRQRKAHTHPIYGGRQPY